MKKSDLKDGMIIQTTHNRFGVIEIDKNRIDICYDPTINDEYKVLEKISLDNIFEFGNNQIGIGTVVTKELKEKYKDSELFKDYNIGEIAIWYEIVAVYTLNKIYDNGEGIFPGLIVGFKQGYKVYHKNLKKYGIFVEEDWASKDSCFVDFGDDDVRCVSYNQLELVKED